MKLPPFTTSAPRSSCRPTAPRFGFSSTLLVRAPCEPDRLRLDDYPAIQEIDVRGVVGSLELDLDFDGNGFKQLPDALLDVAL